MALTEQKNFQASAVFDEKSRESFHSTAELLAFYTIHELETFNQTGQLAHEKLQQWSWRRNPFGLLSSRGLAFSFGLTPIISMCTHEGMGLPSDGGRSLDPFIDNLEISLPLIFGFAIVEQYLLLHKQHQLNLREKTLQAIKELFELEQRLQKKHQELIAQDLNSEALRAANNEAINAILAIIAEIRIYRKKLTKSSYKQSARSSYEGTEQAEAIIGTDGDTPLTPNGSPKSPLPSGKAKIAVINSDQQLETLLALAVIRNKFYEKFDDIAENQPEIIALKPTASADNLPKNIPADLNNPPLSTTEHKYSWQEYFSLTHDSNASRVEFIKRVISPISRAIWPITLALTYGITGDYAGLIFASLTCIASLGVYYIFSKPLFEVKKEQKKRIKNTSADIENKDKEVRRERQLNSVRAFAYQLASHNSAAKKLAQSHLDNLEPFKFFDKEQEIFDNPTIYAAAQSDESKVSFYTSSTTWLYMLQAGLAFLTIASTFGAGSSMYALANKAEVASYTTEEVAKAIGGGIFLISFVWAYRDLHNNWRNIGIAVKESHHIEIRKKRIDTKISAINEEIKLKNNTIRETMVKHPHLKIDEIEFINTAQIESKFKKDNPISIWGHTTSDHAYTAMKIFKKGAYKASRATSYLFFLSTILTAIPGVGAISWVAFAATFAAVFAVATAEYIIKRVNKQRLEQKQAIEKTTVVAIERKYYELQAAEKKLAMAQELPEEKVIDLQPAPNSPPRGFSKTASNGLASDKIGIASLKPTEIRAPSQNFGIPKSHSVSNLRSYMMLREKYRNPSSQQGPAVTSEPTYTLAHNRLTRSVSNNRLQVFL